MIRIVAVAIALLCLASESQAQFLPGFQPFGGRFRPCHPIFPIFHRCQPQCYSGPVCSQYTVPSQPYYIVPNQQVVPGPMVLPAPKREATKPVPVPAVVATPEGNKPKPDPNPAKVTAPAKDAGPKVLPAPKRN